MNMKEMNLEEIEKLIWEQMHKLKEGKITYKEMFATIKGAETIMAAEIMKVKFAELTGKEPVMLPANTEK